MKKTVIVNINGIIFHIDEDAYEKLNIYLNTLKRYFHATTEDKEIVEDIEARIAELMQPRISEAKQSIAIEDIEEIIAILGNAEDIAGDAEASREKHTSASYQEPAGNARGTRRLYRDIDNAIIGGVSSGMAAYFNIDPVLFRIIFIALIFAGGISLIIYPILWIAVPAAVSSAQKLEMRGKNVTISNIERQVRDEYARVKNNLSGIDTRSFAGKISGFLNEIFRAGGRVIMAVAIALKYIFAIALIGLAITIIVAFIAGFYFSNFAIDQPLLSSFNSVHEILTAIVSPFDAYLFIVLGLLVVILPCVALIYWGLKLIIRFKARDKMVSVALSIIWLGASITFIALIFNQFKNFKYENTTEEIVHLQKPSKNILYIDAVGMAREKDLYHYHLPDEELFGIDHSGDKSDIIAPVIISLEKATGNEPYIEIEKKGRGVTYEDAAESLKSVMVYTNQTDTTISIDPFFRLRDSKRWKFNRTKVIIHLPEGMNIRFSKQIEPFVYDFRERYWNDDDVTSEIWQMTATGIDVNQQKIIEGHILQSIGNKILNINISDKYPVTEEELTDNNNQTRTVTYKRNGRSYTVTYDKSNDHSRNISFNGRDYKYGVVSFEVEKSNSNEMKIDIIKTVSGTTAEKADKFANKIDCGFVQKDSVLMIDPIYLFPENEKIGKHKIIIKLYIPDQKQFYLDYRLKPLYRDDYWLGKSLQMSNNGSFQTIY